MLKLNACFFQKVQDMRHRNTFWLSMDDRFMKVRAMNNEDLVIYVKDENIFLPNCRPGFPVIVIRHETDVATESVCFEDFPILVSMWNLNNLVPVKVNYTSFITSQGIVVKENRRVKCSLQKGSYMVCS